MGKVKRRTTPTPRAAAKGAEKSRGKKSPGQSAPAVIEIASVEKVPLDGDLVYLIDVLYREFAVKRGFEPAYGDLKREIDQVLDQMDSATTREYFSSSLFLNYVTYENEMAEKLARAITRKAKRAGRSSSRKR